MWFGDGRGRVQVVDGDRGGGGGGGGGVGGGAVGIVGEEDCIRGDGICKYLTGVCCGNLAGEQVLGEDGIDECLPEDRGRD